MTTLDEILSDMGRKLDGAWTLAVSDNDGMLIAARQSSDNKLNPEMFAGQFSRMLRDADTMFTEISTEIPPAAGSNRITLDDIFLTTNSSYVMVRPMCKSSCYLLIDSSKRVPLGLLRLTASNYVPKLEKCLAG